MVRPAALVTGVDTRLSRAWGAVAVSWVGGTVAGVCGMNRKAVRGRDVSPPTVW